MERAPEPNARDDRPELGARGLTPTVNQPQVEDVDSGPRPDTPNAHPNGATRYIVRRTGAGVKITPCVVVYRVDVDLWMVATQIGREMVIGRHLADEWERPARRDLTLAELAMRREVSRG